MNSGLVYRLKRWAQTFIKPQAVGFEQLLQSVAGDEQYRKLVLWICRQNEFQRRSIIRTQLDILSLKRAPSELRVLFQSLEDSEFAAKVTEYLSEQGEIGKK